MFRPITHAPRRCVRPSLPSQSPRTRSVPATRRLPPRRAGSTLMIVIVLLGLLSVLGVLFYVFAAGERSNSEYYAEGAKVQEESGLNVDQVMDFALEQLTIGVDPRRKNSALWGSRHSLLPNELGIRNHRIQDLTAFDGQGVHVAADVNGLPFVDQDYDGNPDTGQLLDPQGQPVFTSQSGSNPQSNPQDLLGANDSPAANGRFERDTGRFPQPDVGYTYPDLNNVYLAYKGYVRDRASGLVRPVIIPSFHRPQLLRDNVGRPVPLWEDFNYNGLLDGGEDLNGNGQLDYGAPRIAGVPQVNRLFRPHPDHVYVPSGSQVPSTRRFIHLASEADSLLGDGKRVFPFVPMYPGYNPSYSGTTFTLNAPPGWLGHQGIWSGPHPANSVYDNPTLGGAITSAPTLHDEYQYDVDNDGDGVREGIWLDLHHPVQQLPDGTLYTLLYSFTVYDLDALLNLNVHGNIQKLLFRYPDVRFDNINTPFGWRSSTGTFEFISASNTGMMPSEVNPAWGLTGRPGIDCSLGQMPTVFAQHQRFFGNLPINATTLGPMQQRLNAYREPANMELAFLKFGRPELNSSGSLDGLHPGLYGEEHLIARYLGTVGNRDPRSYPHPGASSADDNSDQNEHMQTPPSHLAGTTPTWLEVEHPYDALGFGTYLTGPKAFDLQNPGNPAFRVRWLRYTDYASNGNVFWGQSNMQSGNLMRVGPPPYSLGGQAWGLFDDPSEVALWPTDRRDVDHPFEPSEAAWLHLANSDITNLSLPSRLHDLAPFNFATSNSANTQGETIRQRFTTLANDRKSYGLPRLTGTDGVDWLWTDDQGFNTSAGHSKLRFPPTFGPAGSPIFRYTAQSQLEDPFRLPVRYLLQATRDDLHVAQYQQRLSVNQLLVYEQNQLQYRDLTPHPLDPGSAEITAPSGITQSTPRPNLANLTPQLQEFWARRDRQMLARDIYVLLYLLGTADQGSSASNPTRPGWTGSYSAQQLEQMARFAVNLVDAQDRDNVMTRFEYDTDLSNGWNLDDNPYTSSGESDRAEVYGVERQELALSEFLIVQANQSTTPRTYTSWDDSEDRQFFCVELRNVAPYDVKFTDNEHWQLLVRQEPAMPTPPANWRRITLRNMAGRVTAGGFYTLFSTDRNEPGTNPSALRVDPNGGGALQPIVPSDPTFLGNATANGSFIDLVKEYQQNGFRLTDGDGAQDLTNTPGALLNDGGTSLLFTDLSTPVQVILLRRAHPTRTKPSSGAEENDNPWIEVDRIAADIKTFAPNTNNPTDIAAALDGLKSRERREILARTTEGDADPSTGTTDHVWNTFKAGSAGENSLAPLGPPGSGFRYLQAHFDRPFVSLGELLHVPLVGPAAKPLSDNNYGDKDGLTVYLEAMRFAPQADNAPTARGQYGAPNPSSIVGLTGANIRFLHSAKTFAGAVFAPDHPTQGTAGIIDPQWDNRWYRLLEFLEIPTRQHKNLGMGSTFEIKRQAGKLNLNTLRHPEVLAGLLDEESVCDLAIPFNTGSSPTNERLATLFDPNENEDVNLNGVLDPGEDVNGNGWLDRSWFEQLQWSRDQRDRYWAAFFGRELALPGLPGSRPFQSFGLGTPGIANSTQHTLLRPLPADQDLVPPPPHSRRTLLEVGTLGEHLGSGPSGALDPVLRYRLLSKIWGNTTVRSNTFVVFVSAKMFRVAIDPLTGAERIGGPVREFNTPYQGQPDQHPEEPEYRGVFIIDRSRLEEALTASGGAGITSFTPFVVHRRILRE